MSTTAAWPEPSPSPVRSLEGLGAAVVVSLALCAVVDLASIVNLVIDNRMLSQAIEEPGSVSHDRLQLSDTLAAASGGARTLALLVTAILFLVWLARGVGNLSVWSIPRHGRAMSIISWFIPILAWFIPKQVVNDLWRAGEQRDDYPVVFNVWWAMWIVTNLIYFGALRRDATNAELAELRDYNNHDIAASAADVVAAVLCIVVVREITRRHAERAVTAQPAQRWPQAPRDFETRSGWQRPAEDAGA